MNKTIQFLNILLIGILASTSISCKKKHVEAEQPPMDVSVAVPDIDSVMLRRTFPGYLTARNEVDLVARVDGILLSHPYSPGSRVGRGDILFTIDPTTYQNQVEQARASLDNAQSSYDYYSRQYEAMCIALQSDAVSQMEVLQAKSNMDEAAAQIRNYQAALETALTTLGYCTVRAPFDGRVTVTNFDTGNYLSGATSPVTLATIYDDEIVYANIEIDADTYNAIISNANENLDLNNIPVTFGDPLPHSYTAKLEYMAPDIDRTTGTIRLRATIQNPYGELKSGMFVSVDLPYQHLDNAVIIEDAAIGTDQLGKYIYVVNDSNQIVYTPIVVSEVIDNTRRVVLKGIDPGQRYVTRALLKVRDGEKVKPIMN